jgi:hypothetical protein
LARIVPTLLAAYQLLNAAANAINLIGDEVEQVEKMMSASRPETGGAKIIRFPKPPRR